jgi:hypothetical protein
MALFSALHTHAHAHHDTTILVGAFKREPGCILPMPAHNGPLDGRPKTYIMNQYRTQMERVVVEQTFRVGPDQNRILSFCTQCVRVI